MNSPFSDRSGTNYIPTDDEVVQIRDIISSFKPERRVQDLAAETKRLQALHDDILADWQGHAAMLNPLRRMSPELLQTIFMHCLPTQGEAIMHASEAPLLLGRVCSQWREIAYNTPALWASIHIVVPRLDAPDISQRRLAACQEWLSRSGVVPLDFTVVNTHVDKFIPLPAPIPVANGPVPAIGQDNFERLGDKAIAPFLDLLVPHCRRWRSMHLMMPPDFPKAFVSLTSEDVPLLTSFSLEVTGFPLVANTPEVGGYYGFLESLVGLKSIALLLPHYLFTPEAIPWFPPYEKQGLTDLTLRYGPQPLFSTREQLLSFLSDFPQLQSCWLEISTTSVPLTDLSHEKAFVCQLPHLRSLRLHIASITSGPFGPPHTVGGANDHSDHIDTIAGEKLLTKYMYLPMLRHLDLRVQQLNAFTTLRQLVLLSDCKLEVVKLYDVIDDSTDLEAFLILFPDIRELGLHFRDSRVSVILPGVGQSSAPFVSTTPARAFLLRLLARRLDPVLPNMSKFTLFNLQPADLHEIQPMLDLRSYGKPPEGVTRLSGVIISSYSPRHEEWPSMGTPDEDGLYISLPKEPKRPVNVVASPWAGSKQKSTAGKDHMYSGTIATALWY